MVVVDPEARMMLVNAQVERVFGYQREELLGQKIEMLVPERRGIGTASSDRIFSARRMTW